MKITTTIIILFAGLQLWAKPNINCHLLFKSLGQGTFQFIDIDDAWEKSIIGTSNLFLYDQQTFHFYEPKENSSKGTYKVQQQTEPERVILENITAQINKDATYHCKVHFKGLKNLQPIEESFEVLGVSFNKEKTLYETIWFGNINKDDNNAYFYLDLLM